MKQVYVDNITYDEVYPWVIKKHYAHRMPAVIESFGLFNKNKLIGVVCYGPGANNQEQKIWADCGYSFRELVRLCVDPTEIKNASSILVSNSIKMLEKPCVIISYADKNQGHVGYIYQATNWIYTGLSSISTVYLDTLTDIEYHAKSIFDKYGTNVINDLPKKYQLKKKLPKHRYYYFIGSKSEKKNMNKLLRNRFKIASYPKGETKRYEIKPCVIQHRLF